MIATKQIPISTPFNGAHMINVSPQSKIPMWTNTRAVHENSDTVKILQAFIYQKLDKNVK